MIEPETTIRFLPEDVPPLAELRETEDGTAGSPEQRPQTPEPEGWRPLGAEW